MHSMGFGFRIHFKIEQYFIQTIGHIIDSFSTLCLWEGVFGFSKFVNIDHHFILTINDCII